MASTNMFALLNSEDDDEPQQKKTVAPSKAVAAPAREKKDNNRKPKGRNQEDKTFESAPSSQPAPSREGKGKGSRSRGKGRGGKGETSRGDSGREYPRRSATGRGRENSKDGAGKYNWGKEDGSNQTADGEKTEAEVVEGAEAAADPAPIEREVEEEDNSISLQEYEAQQAEAKASLNRTLKQRTIEEDDSLTVITDDVKGSNVEDSYSCMFHEAKAKKKHGKKKGREGAKQADQVLNLKFVDEDAGSKGKGGKGGKGRSGGKGREGKAYSDKGSSKSVVDLSNDSSFPTLGA